MIFLILTFVSFLNVILPCLRLFYHLLTLSHLHAHLSGNQGIGFYLLVNYQCHCFNVSGSLGWLQRRNSDVNANFASLASKFEDWLFKSAASKVLVFALALALAVRFLDIKIEVCFISAMGQCLCGYLHCLFYCVIF